MLFIGMPLPNCPNLDDEDANMPARPVRFVFIDDDAKLAEDFGKAFGPKVQIYQITSPPYFDPLIEEAIARFEPDLIVLDLWLAEEGLTSGVRILNRVKSSNRLKDIGVVAVSSHLKSHEWRRLEKGVRPYLLDAISKNDPKDDPSDRSWTEQVWQRIWQIGANAAGVEV